MMAEGVAERQWYCTYVLRCLGWVGYVICMYVMRIYCLGVSYRERSSLILFNVGCLFVVDVFGRRKINALLGFSCVFPKKNNVRSCLPNQLVRARVFNG